MNVPNDRYHSTIRQLLADGYGIDDIAVMTETSRDWIKKEVDRLRANGEITGIVRGRPND